MLFGPICRRNCKKGGMGEVVNGYVVRSKRTLIAGMLNSSRVLNKHF